MMCAVDGLQVRDERGEIEDALEKEKINVGLKILTNGFDGHQANDEVRINWRGTKHQKLLLRFRRGVFGLLPPPQFMNKRLRSGWGFGW